MNQAGTVVLEYPLVNLKKKNLWYIKYSISSLDLGKIRFDHCSPKKRFGISVGECDVMIDAAGRHALSSQEYNAGSKRRLLRCIIFSDRLRQCRLIRITDGQSFAGLHASIIS
jgi:hypothetical protein